MLRRVTRVLEENHLCSIATVNADGTSHINTAYFSFTDVSNLYFLSNPRTAHCRNIASRGNVSLTICDSRQPWGESLLGLQLFGESSLAAGDDVARAEHSYSARFESYKTWIENDANLLCAGITNVVNQGA
ncbi:MAG: pyridoxamine 5'-phosphate oxidase family protein [Planctomycetes bacterium]|nr:pyridoxamine 5'-phosphate oxidase family protein [Planctomycetota bacterium]